jgi:hypothetical protein
LSLLPGPGIELANATFASRLPHFLHGLLRLLADLLQLFLLAACQVEFRDELRQGEHRAEIIRNVVPAEASEPRCHDRDASAARLPDDNLCRDAVSENHKRQETDESGERFHGGGLLRERGGKSRAHSVPQRKHGWKSEARCRQAMGVVAEFCTRPFVVPPSGG